jgi:hypothetical protein
MMRILLLKSLLFVFLIVGLQLVITLIRPINSVAEIQQLDGLLTHDTNVIYFGDSTITSFAEFEENKDFISTLLQEMQPNQTIGRISYPAYHLGVFLEYARYIVNQKHLPQVVIIPINLRSFSPGWDLNPGYQFDKEVRFLQQNNNLFVKAFDTSLSIFRWYKPKITQKTFETTSVYNGSEKVGVVEEFEKIFSEASTLANKGNILIYNYLYDLRPEHRKLQSMLELVDIYHANNIHVILYITPIDYQLGESLLGDSFSEQVTQNTALITSMLAEKDVVLLDLSNCLTSEYFGWHEYPNEHLNENGRFFVAEKLSRELDRLQN